MKRLHNRRSIRLKGYDYARPGGYFVTICTQDRACLFGEVVGGKMMLNDAGRMVARWWDELNRKFSNVKTDAFVIMPNHIHGIIMIEPAASEPVGADLRVCPDAPSGAHVGAPLPVIVQWFKTMTTNAYIRGVKQSRWPAFHRRLWQRNYYERIIRDGSALERIRTYIANNPAKWDRDRNNPMKNTKA